MMSVKPIDEDGSLDPEADEVIINNIRLRVFNCNDGYFVEGVDTDLEE